MLNPVDVRRDRFKGCLIGQCLGDALGFAVATQPDQVQDNCAGTGLENALCAANYGQYTDASQLARELMLSLAGYEGAAPHDSFYETRVKLHMESWEHRGFNPSDFADRIKALALEDQLFGRDMAIEDACLRLVNEIDWFAAGAPASDLGNSSAARAGPIGLFFWNKTSAIISATLSQAIITHRSRRCVAGAIAIAGAVALILRETPLTDEFTDTLRDWVKIYDPLLASGIEHLQEWRTLTPSNAYTIICDHCSSAQLHQQVPDQHNGSGCAVL